MLSEGKSSFISRPAVLYCIISSGVRLSGFVEAARNSSSDDESIFPEEEEEEEEEGSFAEGRFRFRFGREDKRTREELVVRFWECWDVPDCAMGRAKTGMISCLLLHEKEEGS